MWGMVMHMIWIWSAILLLSVYQTAFLDGLLDHPGSYPLDGYTWESEAFRNMQMGECLSGQPNLDLDCLTALMVSHDYDLSQLKEEEVSGWEGCSFQSTKHLTYKLIASKRSGCILVTCHMISSHPG